MHTKGVASIAAGIAISVVGLAVMCWALAVAIDAGLDPTFNQNAAILIIGIAGFVMIAAGVEIRIEAVKQWRKAKLLAAAKTLGVSERIP